ncbi:hypothetical protein BH11BAC3_BH11BAC3_21650 [soil metagenome]
MKANNDQQLEAFVDGLMKNTSLDSLSPDFTKTLMNKILVNEVEQAVVYKPLISKRAWWLMGAGIILLIIYFMNIAGTPTDNWIQPVDFGNKMDDFFKQIPVLTSSAISLYAVVILAVMLFVQIAWLKKYFNRRAQF